VYYFAEQFFIGEDTVKYKRPNVQSVGTENANIGLSKIYILKIV